VYQDQYAAALNFMIRLQARQAVTVKMFMAGLAPAERARVREKAYVGFRSSNMIVENILRGDRGRGQACERPTGDAPSATRARSGRAFSCRRIAPA
jgi:hypothetical protein